MSKSSRIFSAKFRKALAQLPNLPRALGLVWSVAKPWTIAWSALLVIQGLLPAATVYLTKLVVDAVLYATKAGALWPEVRKVLILVASLAGVMLLMELARSAINWIRTVQAELLQDHIHALIHEKSAGADLAFYEFPDYYDHLHRARTEATYRPVALLENLGSLLQNGITLLAMGAMLIPLGPWLSLALIISSLPAFYVVLRYAEVQYEWRQRMTADERRTWYYDWVLTAAEAAAEVRLFRLAQHFQSAYQNLRRRLRNERVRVARQQGVAELGAGVIALAIMGGSLAYMAWKAMRGLITLGDLALIYAAFTLGQRLVRTLLESVGQLYANSLFLGNLFEFLALQPLVAEPEANLAAMPRDVRREINFSNVSFSYPQSERRALDDFNLIIRAGSVVAIVGPNGAGKSTLVKLLCRFYDPIAGRIEVDGTDIKNIPTGDLRRLITVLFQQPVHYNATVRENIEYGDLGQQLGDVKNAAHAAGADEIIARLPEDYEAVLGKWFSGGSELSVGEWQRIALARAFLRQAPIIILDEPTSALDPWSEADWLRRFRQLARGRTALIITHRFTTAMHADVIHVVHSGRIIESGTHDELLLKNGPYAESWSRQMYPVEPALP
jgi:ATP-binding cassette subfamily B protein